MKFFYFIIITIISLFFLIKKKDTNLNLGKLSGEWMIESTEESTNDFSSIGKIYYFYGDSIRIFDNEYLYGTYELNDSVLSYQIKGYPVKNFIIKKGTKTLKFFNPEENVHYILKPYGSFDFMLFIFLFLIGIISIAILINVFESLYVLFVSSTWHKIRAKAISTKINVSKYEKYKTHAQLSDYQFKEVSRDALGFGYKITSKFYSPYVKIEYNFNNKLYSSDNSDYYNKISYTEKESKDWIEEWNKNGVQIKINPNKPTQVYFGWKHFPFVWTILLFIVSTLLSVSFFTSIEMILNIFNLEFKRLNGTVSIFVFIIPTLFFVYLILSIIKNILFKGKIVPNTH